MNDSTARELALDPHRSFIVQAPAGSGKTELLIQRYLSLLAVIEKSPDEILAITFTRKAATEMRERIAKALALSLDEKPEGHAAITWELARTARARLDAIGWDLSHPVVRLNIQTIDSFCHSLLSRSPLLSRGEIPPTCSETEAQHFYEQAAQRLLFEAQHQENVSVLLLHFDNRIEHLTELLVEMLAKRDLWLPIVGKIRGDQSLRQTLEDHLEILVNQLLFEADRLFPQALKAELSELIAYAHQQDTFIFPASHTEHLADWKKLGALLLTQSQSWRRTVNASQGFPPQTEGKTTEEKQFFKTQKDRMSRLLETLATIPDLEEALSIAASSPAPHYNEAQWQVLSALLELLPLACAELKVLFKLAHKTDFVELSEAALRALGNEEAPSLLALELDRSLKHILVDEFQDTSSSQFRLLTLLLQNGNEKGRSLFLVGDPMQSIYRFRGAEVGIFLNVIAQGIAQVPLTFLQLTQNFRSQKNIIDWINHTFSTLFPQQEAASQSKIKFTASYATQAAFPHEVQLRVESLPVTHGEQVLKAIAQARQSDPTGSIAILVRSRSHLAEILPALQIAGIAYEARDIEKLDENMQIQDLLSLTCALLHEGDRLAWLSLLRSPMIGLSLHDLYALAQQAENKTLWQVLHHAQDPRLTSLRSCFEKLRHYRGRFRLREIVEETWRVLQGDRYYVTPSDEQNRETFFDLLEQLENQEDCMTRELLERYLKTLYAKVGNTDLNAIQIMTIHKAKGLEFDTVILPALEAAPRSDVPPLLLWFEQPNLQGGFDLLIAPKPQRQMNDPLYDYLRGEHTRMLAYESMRLFYVAATRARKQLYLLGRVEKDLEGNTKAPPEKSWLSKLISK